MKTTLRKIRSFDPCADGYRKLCEYLGTNDPDTEVTILQILNNNGVKDAYWALRTQKYKAYCLILADVAESVLHIFENEYSNDDRVRKAIEANRLYHAGEITEEELNKVTNYAADTAHKTSAAAAYAAAYAATFAFANAYSAYIVADSAAFAFANAYSAYIVADSAAFASDSSVAAKRKQWEVNERILRKYLEAGI